MGKAAHYGCAERDGFLGGASSGGGVGDGLFCAGHFAIVNVVLIGCIRCPYYFNAAGDSIAVLL